MSNETITFGNPPHGMRWDEYGNPVPLMENKQQNTESKCTCVEHDPYCCQIHGNCPVCVKPEEPEDVVLGYKTSLVAQTMDSMTNNKQQTIRYISDEEIEKENPFVFGSKHLGTRDMDIWELGAKWMRNKIYGGNK